MEMKKTILNPEGLHARPAGQLAKVATSFKSKIEVIFNQKTVNAKSAMSLMTLGIIQSSEVIIKADGPDAEEAIQKIATLIDNHFSV
ncbi:MAG: HPr family phosphocarrier protein [Bdellovibrionaceae bacterium]|nr:HPr family phosphocarrier protein [Pseudobdellovibrionaceae bacterium]